MKHVKLPHFHRRVLRLAQELLMVTQLAGGSPETGFVVHVLHHCTCMHVFKKYLVNWR